MFSNIFSRKESLDNIYSTENNTSYWCHYILFLASLAAFYQAVRLLIYGIYILTTIFHNLFLSQKTAEDDQFLYKVLPWYPCPTLYFVVSRSVCFSSPINLKKQDVRQHI